MNTSLHLYRQILREAKRFTVAVPVGKKIAFNTREVFEARREERDPAAVARMHGDAQAALRAIAWLKALPPVRGVCGGDESRSRRTTEQADVHGRFVALPLNKGGAYAGSVRPLVFELPSALSLRRSAADPARWRTPAWLI